MELYFLSAHLLSIAFIFPVFRQYKGFFFKFFLLLSSSSAVSFCYIILGINKILGINPNIINLLVVHFLIYSMHPSYFKRKINNALLSIYTSLSFIMYFSLNHPYLYIYFIFVNFIVIALIANRMLRFVHKYLELRYFHLALLLFEISVIGKYLSMVMDITTGIHYFTLTNFFQIFLALYFCFVREDTPNKAIKLTWNDDLIRDHLESPYFKKWDI